MPFQFLQDDGAVRPIAPVVPLGDFATASFQQGASDTFLGFIGRQFENFDANYDDGPTLDPKTANEKYGTEGLSFDRPVTERRAQMMYARKFAENERLAIIQQGTTGFGRFALGMGAGLVGSVSNPLDFAANVFIPFVGESKAARVGLEAADAGVALAKAGRFATFMRGGGIVTSEELAKVGLPRGPVFAAVMEGAIANAAIEVPLAFEKIAQERDSRYGVEDFMLNVGAGAVFAGGLRLSMEGLGRLLSRITPETHSAAMVEALGQIARNEEVNVARTLTLDDPWIRETVRAEALKRVDAEMGAGIQAQSASPRPLEKLVELTPEEKADPRMEEAGVTKLAAPNQITIDLRNKESVPIGELVIKSSGDPAKDAQAVVDSIRKASEENPAVSWRESAGVLADERGLGVLHYSNTPAGPAWASVRDLVAARNPDTAARLESAVAEAIPATRDQLLKQYYEEMLPKTPEDLKKYQTRYDAERAQQLDAVARNGDVIDPAEAKRMAEMPPEQLDQMRQEQIDSLKEIIGEEELAKAGLLEAGESAKMAIEVRRVVDGKVGVETLEVAPKQAKTILEQRIKTLEDILRCVGKK